MGVAHWVAAVPVRVQEGGVVLSHRRSRRVRRGNVNVSLRIHTPKLGNVDIDELFRKIFQQEQEIERLKKKLKVYTCRPKVTGLKRKVK